MSQIELNIRIDNQTLPFLDDNWVRQVVEKALIVGESKIPVELSIVITGDQLVHQLNKKYRGVNGTTDVLSFAFTENGDSEENAFVTPPDGVIHLGEIIISCPQAKRQAKEQGHSVENELSLLITHGVLHLLGYNHNGISQKIKMQNLEQQTMNLLKEIT